MERVVQQLFDFLEPLEDQNFNHVVILKNNTVRLRQAGVLDTLDEDKIEQKRARIFTGLLSLLKDLEADVNITKYYNDRINDFLPTKGAEKVVGIIQSLDGRVQNPVFELTSEAILGRASSCHITINDDRISRNHAKLIVQYERVLLMDLSSRNKTYIGEQEIRCLMPVELKGGTIFKLYDVEFLFKNAL